MRLVAFGLAAVLAGCGGEREGVTVTEADPVEVLAPSAPPPPRLDAPLDTIYADSVLVADSLAADTTDADSLQVASVPEFRAFYPRFREALDGGPEAVAALSDLDPEGTPLSVLFDDLFIARVRALTARDFRIDGDVRDVWVTVGFDRDGNVVPEDEAETESGLGLRFEVVDGAYRLVRLDAAG